MSKQMKSEKQVLVPRLRFPEFRDAGGWDIKPLDEVCEVLNNRRKPITSSNRVSGPYPYYGASGIVDYVADFIFYERLVLVGEDGAKWGAFEKTAFIAKGKYWVNNHAHVLKSLGMNDVLLEAYLTMLDVGPYITGAAPPKLTLGKLKQIPICLPALTEEQQKIADCLTSLDALIAAQADKVNALKTHKKGLMQQLFPREGETVPRLRFPEFRDAGEWEENTLGEVARFINGKAYKQNELLESGKYRVLRVGNFFSNNNWYYSDLELDEDKYCDDGDLLYAWSASFGPRIWKGEKVIYHYHIWKVEEKTGVNRNFLFIVLDHETERMKSNSANGMGLLHITKSTIESWKCAVPDPEEQKKIADCLSSLDALIAAHSEKLDALKTHKKGLMQQLFPSPEAVGA
jgi:type I restriction enzyme S subunit